MSISFSLHPSGTRQWQTAGTKALYAAYYHCFSNVRKTENHHHISFNLNLPLSRSLARPTCLSMDLLLYLSIIQFINSSIYQRTWLSVCLFIYPLTWKHLHLKRDDGSTNQGNKRHRAGLKTNSIEVCMTSFLFFNSHRSLFEIPLSQSPLMFFDSSD